MICFWDFETRSDVDIKRGAYVYAEAPTTSSMCGHLRREDGLECFWTPHQYVGWEPPPGVQYVWGMPWLIALFSDPENTFIAHNSEFDRAIAEITLKLPPARWIDSQALADYLGFPGSLEAIAQHLWGVGKDKAGYQLMMKLCKPYRGGWVEITHDHLTQLCIYNMRDAELMARFWNEYAALLPAGELPVFLAHQASNFRGVCFDREWAQGLINMNQLIGGIAAQAAEQATGGIIKATDLSRVVFLKKWINQVGALHGWSVDSVDEETVTPMLQAAESIVPPYLKLVLEARLATSRASIKKMDSALNAVSADGRLRGQLRYCIAEGTLVPTNLGWVEIQDLDPCIHLVWDGVEYVFFEALLDNGVRQCICIDGTWLTSDHKVLDASRGWVSAADVVSTPYHCPGRFMADGRLLVAPSLSESGTGGTPAATPSGSSPVAASAGECPTLLPRTWFKASRRSVAAVEPRSVTAAITILLLTTLCVVLGGIAGSTWWLAVVTLLPVTTLGMVVLASQCVMSGAGTLGLSSRTSKPSLVGTRSFVAGWISTAETLFEGMSQVISASSRTASTTEIAGTALSLPYTVAGCAPQSRTSCLSASAATTTSSSRSMRVFDLKNCGVRHRFQAGRVIAHNCGAHTHRWTGRGVQLQNLPRPHPAFSGDNPEAYKKTGEANPFHSKALIERAREACIRLDPAAFLGVVRDAEVAAKRISADMTISTNDVLTSLIRPMFHAAPGKVIVGADYSQIEGRGAAWIAGDEDEMKAYRANDAGTGPDLYCVMASKIFGRAITKENTNERQAGKVAVLGAGYGMSSDRFDDTNAQVLLKAGVERGVIIPLWRQTHPRHCYAWRACEKAFRRTILGRRPERLDGGFVFDMQPDGRWLTLTFPSGRQMFYHNARIERVDDDPRSDDTQLVYDNFRKSDGDSKVGRIKTYGAKIFENVVQSFCRDFLAQVNVDAEAAGLPVIMHTHDEVNTEVWADQAKDAAAWLKQRMAQAPTWAPDIPLKGAPSTMYRYSK